MPLRQRSALDDDADARGLPGQGGNFLDRRGLRDDSSRNEPCSAPFSLLKIKIRSPAWMFLPPYMVFASISSKTGADGSMMCAFAANGMEESVTS